MLKLKSSVRKDSAGNGTVVLSLVTVPIPDPKPKEVVVRVDAAPLNPSDMSLLLAHADTATLQRSGGRVLSARIPQEKMGALETRIGKSMSAGNEGAGVVVKAGDSGQAQALLGKVVGCIGGEMYSQYRVMHSTVCQAMPEGVTAAEASAWFVNPMAALLQLETMRMEGHNAAVLTAAASNMGRMMNRVCLADGVPLVNIVNEQLSPGDSKLLKGLGAKHVVDQSSNTFTEDLADAIVATKATVAFDAVGGGELCGQILACMQTALNRAGTEFSIYGGPGPMQVYVYGGLAPGPIVIDRSPPLNMHWSAGGWLVATVMQQLGNARVKELRARIAREIGTTFASTYARTVSMEDLLDVDVVRALANPRTGGKYLLCPHLKAGGCDSAKL